MAKQKPAQILLMIQNFCATLPNITTRLIYTSVYLSETHMPNTFGRLLIDKDGISLKMAMRQINQDEFGFTKFTQHNFYTLDLADPEFTDKLIEIIDKHRFNPLEPSVPH